jgi:hypothetical protein
MRGMRSIIAQTLPSVRSTYVGCDGERLAAVA